VEAFVRNGASVSPSFGREGDREFAALNDDCFVGVLCFSKCGLNELRELKVSYLYLEVFVHALVCMFHLRTYGKDFA
jgi:hypothetical protein